MSTPLCYPIISEGNDSTANGKTLTLATGAVSTPIFIGKNHLFRIISSSPVNIRFGDATLTTATADDVQTSAGMPEIFDMGSNKDYIVLFNGGSGDATVNIVVVSRQ
jgi:hypothetical protein